MLGGKKQMHNLLNGISMYVYFYFPMLFLQEDLSIKSTVMIELTTVKR